ncbi:MAG: cytidylate kinase-like family protein [Chloroflexota bacterium]|uniref:Cytidylate kinase-like family protein n=1 Tax=marine metagenome TaxID=408172 RepID=A0A381N632_9ZZZZ|nr:cytidylate kinase-like family protein [Dehalococcoidia bacterium]MEC9290134.1 cytidylate kinase-like family protein [Chloroflexota bacterium]|tara:strand:+ start:72 stop:770 length:699 start_codon:yes stop_codon:yes gene_type:complete
MPVITINGPIGCGAVTIGQMVSEQMNLNFVDRLFFTEAARIIGTPVGTLIAKEQRVDRFRDRLGRFVQTMLERSAMSGVSGEPYFGRGIENLPPETYMDLTGDGSVAQKLDDKTFIEAMTKVANDLHAQGNAVIIGRGANQILADAPHTLHVGLLAPMEVRVKTLIDREHFEKEEAEIHVEELERAREDFIMKFWKVHPNEAKHYHMMLNMGKMNPQTAAEVICSAAGDLTA